MGKSKSKKYKWIKNLESDSANHGIPIPNLPEKVLLMQVKSGTKIRNVLGYALQEFEKYDSVVWTAAGRGIGKAISCAELFKRKQEGFHQITKLRYIQSNPSKSETEKEIKIEKEIETDTEEVSHYVPEIHILLTKEVKNTSEPGYQAPGDKGEFPDAPETKRKRKRQEAGSNATRIDTEEFAAMGLRTGQKRPKKEQQTEAASKKNKKRGKG